MALEFVHHSDHYKPVASAKNFSQIPEVSGCSPLRVLRSLARVRAQRRKRKGAVALRACIAYRNLLSAFRKAESKATRLSSQQSWALVKTHTSGPELPLAMWRRKCPTISSLMRPLISVRATSRRKVVTRLPGAAATEGFELLPRCMCMCARMYLSLEEGVRGRGVSKGEREIHRQTYRQKH